MHIYTYFALTFRSNCNSQVFLTDTQLSLSLQRTAVPLCVALACVYLCFCGEGEACWQFIEGLYVQL